MKSRILNFRDFASALVLRIFARSENFVAGRYWVLETLFLAVLFTVLFSGGVDERLSIANGNPWFPAYYQKIEHPLIDVAKINPPQNHEAKLNFRLTVPIILHVLHVPSDQHWLLPWLSACGTCALIVIACVFAFRVTGDRVCGLYTALAVSATYTGSFGFTIYYDTIALAQIALAMLPGMHWLLRGLLVFTSGFTDERALLASLFLLVQALCQPPLNQKLFPRLIRPDFLAVIAGLAAYCGARLALEKFVGLTSPHEGIGTANLLWNIRFLGAGIWLALKGGWLLVAVAVISLWKRKQLSGLAAYACVILLCVGAGFLVEDILRSTAYVFPALLIALTVKGADKSIHSLRACCLAAFIISAITGNYNLWRGEITSFQPIAVHFFHSIIEDIF